MNAMDKNTNSTGIPREIRALFTNPGAGIPAPEPRMSELQLAGPAQFLIERELAGLEIIFDEIDRRAPGLSKHTDVGRAVMDAIQVRMNVAGMHLPG